MLSAKALPGQKTQIDSSPVEPISCKMYGIFDGNNRLGFQDVGTIVTFVKSTGRAGEKYGRGRVL